MRSVGAMKLSRFELSKNDIAVMMLSLLYLIGILYPTSIGGVINRSLTMMVTIITLLIFVTMVIIFKKVNILFLSSLFIINLILWLATLLNNGAIIERSVAIFFLLVTLMFCLNLKELHVGKSSLKIFNIVNSVVIVMGILLIMNNPMMGNIVLTFYSDWYPELVPNMVERGKPVATFGTHSVAAFYMFLFFFLNYRVYKTLNKKTYLVISFVFLYFCLELRSNTGLILLAFGIFILFYNIKNKMKFILLAILPVSALVMIFYDKIQLFWMTTQAEIEMTIGSQQNGFLGRYAGGVQSGNMEYLFNNPFSAIGLSVETADLILFDSGLIVTAVRGTILLSIIMYTVLYLFFRKNLVNKKLALFMFFVFFIFETGFNNLYYFRTIMLLPFIIIFLNYLDSEKANQEV